MGTKGGCSKSIAKLKQKKFNVSLLQKIMKACLQHKNVQCSTPGIPCVPQYN